MAFRRGRRRSRGFRRGRRSFRGARRRSTRLRVGFRM